MNTTHGMELLTRKMLPKTHNRKNFKIERLARFSRCDKVDHDNQNGTLDGADPKKNAETA